MAEAAPKAAKSDVRSRDLKKVEFPWEDPKIIHEFPEGHALAGHKVAYIDHPTDLGYLGQRQGHCAGTHFVWACEEKTWYFFTILGPNGQPHVTIHAKQLKWIGKSHPRDTAPFPYQQNGRGQRCVECKGYGGFHAKADGKVDKRNPYYFGERNTVRCENCGGTGFKEPPVEKGAEAPVPFPRPSAGGYPTYADVVEAFERVGRKYEAGKWAPTQFASTTYDIDVKSARDPAVPNWDNTYGNPFAPRNQWNERKPGNTMAKPDNVSDEQWAAFTKLWKEMKDTFDKNVGAVKILGRVFKFDGKELAIVSFSGKGQNEATKYRQGFHECLVELAKRKKEAPVGS